MANDTAATATRRRVLALASVGVGASLAGCASGSDQSTPRPPEATVTVRLRNRDDQPREYEVVVTQGDSLTDSFSGVLPADQSQSVEMVATVRATDEQHEFSIATAGGQRGRTWDPTECDDFLVDAFVEGGEPGFEATCRE
jgi:type IV pilus biogenesis protein CpaD/CtpE